VQLGEEEGGVDGRGVVGGGVLEEAVGLWDALELHECPGGGELVR
jgi:hypothetical protein